MKYPVTHFPDKYLLIVDEKAIVNSEDYVLAVDNIVTKNNNFWGGKKIIAHLTLNGKPVLEGVPLLPALPDTDDTAIVELAKSIGILSGPPLAYFIEGYKANQKKYSNEDILNAMNAACNNKFHQMHGTNGGGEEHFTFCENYIKSLSSSPIPVGFKAEMENDEEAGKPEFGGYDLPAHVKVIDNQWVGEWIYK